MFNNVSSFFTHSVSAGAVKLYPTTFTNTSIFYPATVGGIVSGLTLSVDDIEAITASVLAALNGTTIPVNAVTGNWPTTNEIWSHSFVLKLLTVAKFLGLR